MDLTDEASNVVTQATIHRLRLLKVLFHLCLKNSLQNPLLIMSIDCVDINGVARIGQWFCICLRVDPNAESGVGVGFCVYTKKDFGCRKQFILTIDD
jgi:hypothetical protein